METIRLILIFLHTLIIIFAAVNLHPHFTLIANALNHKKQISAIISYVIDLFCILLYHTASILVVWFSRRYGAGIVRASGILLIGELLKIIALVIQHTLETHHIGDSEFFFIVVYELVLLIAVLITFRLAEKISKYQKDLMQVELLVDNAHNLLIDNGIEPTFL